MGILRNRVTVSVLVVIAVVLVGLLARFIIIDAMSTSKGVIDSIM